MGDNLRATGCPFIKCTPLPAHHRLNKKLSTPFMVVHEKGVPDETEVFIRAGNEEHNVTEMKNYSSKFKDHVAKFNDLRFLSRSGRGKTFVVSIIIMTSPPQIASYENAIKVTVDGKRDPRKQKAKNGYSQGRRKRGFNNADNDMDCESIDSGSNDTSPRVKLPRRGSPIVPPHLLGFGHPPHHQNIRPVLQSPIMSLQMPSQQQISQELLLQYLSAAPRLPPIGPPALSLPFLAGLTRQFSRDPPQNSLPHHPRIMTPYSTPLEMSSHLYPFHQPPRAPPVNTAFYLATILEMLKANVVPPHLSAAANNNPLSMVGGIQIPAAPSNPDVAADRGSSSSTSSASVSSPSMAAASMSGSAPSPAVSAQVKGNTPPNANINARRINVLTPCATSSTTTTTSGNLGGKFSVDRLLKDK